MFWRRKVRSFEVLGERFALPTLDLEGRLDRASRLRQRLGASWFEQLGDPLLEPFRRPERRARLGFIRAHRVLSAHEAIVFAALDHVAIYDDALVRATEHVAQRSKQKVEELLRKAAERRKVAEKAAHLASRVEDQLDADLRLIGERVKLVGKAAHLMLTRLGRYRAFVRQTSRALTERERQLTAQRTLLVHDEHTFELSRELAEDKEIARWHTDPDALCAGIEESLRGMLVDLDGLEGGVAAVPDAVESLLAKAELATADGGFDPGVSGLGELGALPRVGEVPSRLDDGDWDAVLQHELESELVFSARSVEALGVEVVDWLDAQGTGRGRSRACAVCGQAIIGGAALGRAHVLCVRCRDQAMAGGHAWLERHGFAPAREQGSRRYESAVTRLVFEAVMGWVPNVGPAREPVVGVTWYEAIEFCNALSRREGRRPAYRVRGDKVTLRSGSAVGWRLVEGAAPARGVLREWRWGRVDGGAARTLAHGLRPIARSRGGEVDRAVPEVREDDLSFRITCEVEPAVEQARVPEPRPVERRPKSGRSASPITPRPADGAAGRRVVQALSLGMLVSGAAVMLAVEEASVSGASRPVPAESVESVVVSGSSVSVETPAPVPVPNPDEPAEPEGADEPPPAVARPVDVLLEEGYAARAKKDRKAARTAFDRAVVVAPEDLEARYESAREAAYARDTNQAFLHLEVVRQAATTGPKAHRLLMQALSEPDFARLKRDKRWKTIEAATR